MTKSGGETTRTSGSTTDSAAVKADPGGTTILYPTGKAPRMDGSRQVALLPHYGAIVVLTAAVLWAVQVLLGEISLPVGLLSVAVLVLAYPSVVRALGLAPEAWEAE